MKPVKILGGGISGLAAAITLRNAGFDVEVHEQKRFCGKHTRDFQYLENWTFDQDPLGYLRSIGIKTKFYFRPSYRLDVYSPSLKVYAGRSEKPLMYLVKRGPQNGSIDRALEEQAKRAGVRIIYNSALPKKSADIVAIGIKAPVGSVRGVLFRTTQPNKELVIVDNRLSPKWYSYLIANDGIGEIVSVSPRGHKDIEKRLELTIRAFEKLLGIKVSRKRAEKFSAVVSLERLRKARVGNRLFVGEAAGFQDCFAAFGMMYAFRSGYLAAKSIIDSKDYDTLWKKDFLKHIKVSERNRRIFELLSNNQLERMVELLNNKKFAARLGANGDLREILKRLYNHSVINLIGGSIVR